MSEGIQDVDLVSGCIAKVDDIPVIPWHEIEAAAQAVAQAAAEARGREFILDSLASGYEPGSEAYMDTTTGDFYVPTGIGTGRWVNTTTGQEIDHNPTQVSPSEYEWVVSLFTQFHDRWPSGARAMAEHCRNAKTHLQSGRMTPIVSVKDLVAGHWQGAASDDFRDFFLTPFTNAVTNQQALLDELACAMYAYEAVLRQARVDAKNIADRAVDVLDSIDAYGGGGDIGLVLGVLGVAVSVVSAVATGGTSLSITLGLIGAGISGAQLVHGELTEGEPPPKDQQIQGETVDMVLSSLSNVLSDLRTAMDLEERGIAHALGETRSEVANLLSADRPLDVATILPNEPNDDGIVNITAGERPDPSGFHPA
ncbi:MAG TPA: hypothetical protein VIL37_03775 [Natronosporangium sp.]